MNTVKSLLLFILLSSCYGKTPPLKTGLEGKELPSFNLLLADSVTYFNTEALSIGIPIVMFYFGPNCPYSRAQMEEIINNIKIFGKTKFCIFTTWSFNEMKDFYNYYKLYKYPNILTGVDYSNSFATYFKAMGVPYLAIYNKNRKLNHAFVGKMNSHQLKQAIEE
jgi:hypothetical protein